MENPENLNWFADFLSSEGLPTSFSDVLHTVVRPVAEQIAASQGALRRVGLCGAQGSGKSTLTSALARMLQDKGLTVAVLSLDDLYLSRARRQELARLTHPLLATRGVPGTHDVALGIQVLEALLRPGVTPLPRFDKATDDPVPQSAWPRLTGPVDVLLFEGWCVGAQPQPDADLAIPINALERDEDPDGRWRTYVNEQLKDAYADLFSKLDLLVFLQAPDFGVVAGWRLEQAEKLRARRLEAGAATDGLMDEAGVRRFVAHYERVTRALLKEAPCRADVLVRLAADRSVSEVRFRPG